MINHKCAIYSDDNFSGHNLSHLGCSIDRFREIKKKVYLECGLTLKEEACITRPVVNGRISADHQFLGSYFVYYEPLYCYVPYPRVEKICSSLMFKSTQENKPLEDVIAKAISLCILSSPYPELAQEIQSFLIFLVGNLKDKSTIPEEWTKWIGAAQYNSSVWFSLLCGFECNWVDGGFKIARDVKTNADKR